MNIVFMGTPEFSVPVLERLIADEYTILAVVTQPDRPKGRKQVVTPPPVKVTAMAHEIPVLQPKHLKAADDEVLRLKPDLIVTAAYGQMLPSSILEAPRYGCINVHASLLPEYRGGAPIHHAIIDGKNTTGVTIMYMVERMDAGDIVTQIEVPIEETDHVGTMHDKLSEAGANLLSETIPLLIENKLTPQEQVEEEVTFSPNITRNDERIDWSQTGEEIYNRIRGLHPWPVAYTYYEQKPFKVWWGIKQPTDSKASPGTVIAIENDGILIATGNTTAIKITDCQPAGRRRMSAAQFMAGSAIKIGDKFGEEND